MEAENPNDAVKLGSDFAAGGMQVMVACALASRQPAGFFAGVLCYLAGCISAVIGKENTVTLFEAAAMTMRQHDETTPKVH